MMIVEMLVVIVTFLIRGGRKATLSICASVFGLVVSVTCLVLLLVAERERCCPLANDNIFARYLAAASKPEDGIDPADEPVECCPQFGERKYGGLGTIEPFTSLIALSPLRFLFAFYAVKLFGVESSNEDHDSDNETHGHHHGPDLTIKMRDLWMTAIGLHSDIARSFGLFSGASVS